jgi:hypothetical protein
LWPTKQNRIVEDTRIWRSKLRWFGAQLLRLRVTRSLYSRAVGYNYDAVKIFLPAGSKQPVVVHYVEHIPPDVTAGIFWLKNRDPQHWRDSQQLEHVLGRYIISDQPMTEEQWARERATVIDAEPVKDLPKSKQCCPNVVMGIGLLVGSIIISNGYSYADCDPMAERGGRLAGTAGRLDPSAEGQRGQK